MYAIQHPTDNAASPELALIGNCGYKIQDNRVTIDIAQIANQRNFDDISGTLAVELWALKQPYTGLDFNGIALAGTSIGEIAGQHFLADCHYDLNFQEPQEGTWQLVLMLREWTQAGYVTRDYVNFALPYVVNSKPVVARSDTDNVINVSFTEKKPATTAEKAQQQPVENTTAKVAPAPKKEELADKAISLNTASYKEIAAMKGISKKLAETIVQKRPFATFDELKKIKGVGPKLLQKIRHTFTL